MSFEPTWLPREYPRALVPPNTDLGDWAQIEPLFNQLEQRLTKTKEELERWLLDGSELAAAIAEEGAVRYIRMTCQTDDPEREQAYLHFIENIEPKVKQAFHRLDKKYVASPARKKLSHERYFVLDRRIENRVAIFRDENVPLETEATKLAQRYQKLCGAMTVQFEGREQTFQQMAKYLEEPDRKLRQQAWELIVERRLKDREEAVEAYKKALALGGSRPLPELFQAAGLRFDFGPESIAHVVEGLRTEFL